MERKAVLTLLAVVIIFASAVNGQTGPMRGGGFGHGRDGGQGYEWEKGGHIGLRDLMQLDLTREQKLSIYDTLQKQQVEQEKLRQVIHEKKAELDRLSSSAGFDEAAVRQAFREKAQAMEEAVVMRARTTAAIRQVLTAEQLNAIRQEGPGRRESRREHHEFRRAMLDTWLQMDDEQ